MANNFAQVFHSIDMVKEILDMSIYEGGVKFPDRHDIENELVVSDGEIKENGTHNELIKKQGKYYNMWNAEKKLMDSL